MPGDLLTRAALLLALTLVLPVACALNEAHDVEVARVADGDTIELTTGESVRLVQIDAPELGEGECHALQSRIALVSLLRGGDVTLVADPAVRVADQDRADRFGRLLRYVFVDDVNVNLELVRRGSATPWFFAGVRGRYARALMAAAKNARNERRGLWRACPRTKLNPGAPIDTR